MKKMNKSGFTLIELIAVLVILTVIMMIAIPSITASIERNKQKQLDKKIDLIKSAALLYVSDNRKRITKSSCHITINQLIIDGLLTNNDLDNPTKSNTKITGSVKYTKLDGTYEYIETVENDPCF